MTAMMDRVVAATDPALIEDLVDANRILYHLGVVDGFGHVSVRDPIDPSRFIISRSMAPALVTANDLMAIRLDGRPVADNAPTPYLERFIHGEIYAARPDVVAVVHSHSAAIIPFSVVPQATLKPLSHMSGFIGDGAPVFEIRDTAGPTNDMLVRSPELGQALAKSLGRHNIVLMRGHGSTVIGFNLRQAVYRAVYAEVNARQQSEALRLGTPIYLTPGEAVESAKANDGQQDRAWNLWQRAIEGDV
ncbi:MAG TPA: class II aldolase/adducin family protein [Micropepsaceae bacterium]|jgi:HCOMODA/2-hydroxy-3-carboxy-muconic semialdehyde decarboxylase|nr:class II aldolase/adducin family protein [Micropepsaceae bacterium]